MKLNVKQIAKITDCVLRHAALVRQTQQPSQTPEFWLVVEDFTACAKELRRVMEE